MFEKRAVMRSYFDLANNACIADANFTYTEWYGQIITGIL